MPNFPTFSDLFRIGRDEALAREARLSREAIEREGADANILTAGAAAMADEVAGQAADVVAGRFLDSATGDELDRLVFDQFSLLRRPASASLGTVNFTVAGGAPAAFAVPADTRLRTQDGTEFVTVAAAAFAVGAVTVAASVRSALAGADQNVSAATITTIVSPVPGAPAGLTVTNPARTAGGDDAEQDPAYRDRARQFWQAARRGTVAAIEALALGVAGVRRARAFEAVEQAGRPARYVELVVADAMTEAGLASPALALTVYNALDDTRPAGTDLVVAVAEVVLQTVSLQPHFRAGFDPVDTMRRARAAIVDYTNNLRPGEPWVRANAALSLFRVPGLIVLGDEIASPLGDVLPSARQVLRTTTALITPTCPVPPTTATVTTADLAAAI